MVPWVGMRSVIVAFPGHTHLLLSVYTNTSNGDIKTFSLFPKDPLEPFSEERMTLRFMIFMILV